eukprot:jgi/Chlat1/4750/Chrsp308S04722
MPFRRYVEIGRVALVNYGPDYGKLVTIVDVLDASRVLVDAPGSVRHQENLKRLSLTDFKVEVPRMPKNKVLADALAEAQVAEKWAASRWGRKLTVQKTRASLTDFDRFKIMVARIKRGAIVKRELTKLKKASKS